MDRAVYRRRLMMRVLRRPFDSGDFNERSGRRLHQRELYVRTLIWKYPHPVLLISTSRLEVKSDARVDD